MDERVVSYAQNREDVVLAGFFPEGYNGFYVDVGANHPIYDSVTKYFYERGWHGINLEPNKKLWELLEGDRPEDINLCLGVSSRTGNEEITIYDEGNGLSTLSSEMQEEYKKSGHPATRNARTETIKLDTLSNIFKEHGVKKIDFMKIDVEGYEYEVIEGNDWVKYRPGIICIEANHIIKDWRPLLQKARYKEVFFDGLNSYFVASERKDLSERFSYVQALIGRNIISLKWNQELLHQVSLRRGQELENQSLLIQKDELDRQVAFLQSQLNDKRRLRSIVKELLLKIDEIIHHRIDAMNKPKVKSTKKLTPIDAELIEEESDRRQILNQIKKNDLINFYANRPTPKGYGKSYRFVLLNYMYTNTRRLVVLIAKTAYSLLKKVRRIAR